ncbi:MAG: hypothetical protein O3C22_06340 [Bacteroidetes bacterium]|nr:hypothetical protein [Bacteroidota bacterium]MDA0943889.1 hypothetical protein [Bacteroidota bacterium]MDA1112070.1 hypothetical protein [Bacteroidota bacterium]
MKFKHILWALAVPALAFLASCGEDSKDPKPTLALTGGAGLIAGDCQVGPDSMLAFSITATAGSENLKGVTITASVNGASAVVAFDTMLTGKTASFLAQRQVAGNVGDEVVYTITAADANGQTAEVKLNIEVTPALLPLDNLVQGQKVYNYLYNGFTSGYNLNLGVALTSGSAGTLKDILDKTPTGAAEFTSTWGSGNGAKFVRVTANDFTNASTTTFLYNLWKANAASATTEISNIVKNDIILVKTGQDLTYNIYILKIENVVINTAAGNHNDYIQFAYKGKDN